MSVSEPAPNPLPTRPGGTDAYHRGVTLTVPARAGTGGAVDDDAPAAAIADLPPHEPTGPGPAAVPGPLRGWSRRERLTGWYITVVVTALAAVTRFWGLDTPRGKQFDEVYYATEAQELLRYGYESDPGYMFIVHPSVGKWCIAISSWLFGNNETGWRVAPALAGTLAVLLTVRIARRMLRSNLLGGLAGLLLTMDGVSLVQSRVALLDIFLQLFVLAGFGALVVDRDQFRDRLARFLADGGDARAGVPALGPRPWRLLGGVLLGLACGVKWTGLSFLGLFAAMSLVWDLGALKSAGVRHRVPTALRRSWLGAVGSLGIAPVAAYLFTWLGWWAGENSWNRHWADTHPAHGLAAVLPRFVRSLINYHQQAYSFHEGLDSFHPYRSEPWSWLILGRPVLYTYHGTPTGADGHSTCGASSCVDSVLLIGTPIMWWAFTPVLLWLVWHWATTRDWRAATVLVAFVAGWAVWLQDPKRTMFLFYMTPLVPFLVLGLTLALGLLIGGARTPSLRLLWYRPNWRVLLAAGYLGLVVADFAWMWPLFTDVTISFHGWQGRIWFQSWI